MQSENSFASHLVQIAKAVLLSILFCLAAVLIFSLILKFANLSDSVVKPVNQCIKAFAILFGCFFGIRGEKGWLKGLVAGLLTVMLTYLVFCYGRRRFLFVLADSRGAGVRRRGGRAERYRFCKRPSRLKVYISFLHKKFNDKR